MAEQKDITVIAKTREGRGKNDARRARAAGMVPVTVYGGEGGSVAALAPLRDLAAILRSESGRNTIFRLDIEGVGSSEVMFHERQIDPVRGRLIHADLTRLVKGQKIEVTVPLHKQMIDAIGRAVAAHNQLVTFDLPEIRFARSWSRKASTHSYANLEAATSSRRAGNWQREAAMNLRGRFRFFRKAVRIGRIKPDHASKEP